MLHAPSTNAWTTSNFLPTPRAVSKTVAEDQDFKVAYGRYLSESNNHEVYTSGVFTCSPPGYI